MPKTASPSYEDVVPFFLKMVNDRVFAAQFETAFAKRDFATAKRLVKSSGVKVKFTLMSNADHLKLGSPITALRNCFKIGNSEGYFCTS